MPFLHWLNKAESLYDIPGFQWTRGKPWTQLVMGLLCGANLFSLCLFLFYRQPNPKTFILFFVRDNIPILISMAAALASILVLTGLFSLAVTFFAWAFYGWVCNALILLNPWVGHRFRAMALAVFYTWAFTAILNTLLFVLNRTELGSHLFVVFYTGTGVEFMYEFLITPGFYFAAFAVGYPLTEILCHLSGSHKQITRQVRLQNHMNS